MKHLGFEYCEGKKGRVRFTETPKKKKQINRLALEWSQALQLEAAGTHINAYMDESFLNTGHTNTWSWFFKQANDKARKFLNQQTGKGSLSFSTFFSQFLLCK